MKNDTSNISKECTCGTWYELHIPMYVPYFGNQFILCVEFLSDGENIVYLVNQDKFINDISLNYLDL